MADGVSARGFRQGGKLLDLVLDLGDRFFEVEVSAQCWKPGPGVSPLEGPDNTQPAPGFKAKLPFGAGRYGRIPGAGAAYLSVVISQAGRLIMRAMYLALALAALGMTVQDADAQATRDQNWARCASNDASYDLQIGGCTAIIQSGQEDTQNLVIAFGNRGISYRNRGDYAAALADFNQALSLNPNDADSLINRGATYRRMGDYDRALADYQEALRINPSHSDAWNSLGTLYLNREDYQRAITNYNEAIRLNARRADYWTNRGIAYRNMRDYTHALADFAQSLAVNPNYANAYYGRAVAYEEMRDWSHASADYDQADRVGPNDPDTLNGRCWTRAAAGADLDVARTACDRSLALRPNDASTLDSRGMVGLKQQRWQDAWADYDAAVRAAPNYASARYGRGIAAIRQGRTTEGQADLAAATAMSANIANSYAQNGVTP